MLTKSMMIETMDETGTGLARIAQLAAVDSDGDTYAAGAFGWKEGGGQWLSMIPAHDRRAMPFGKAFLHEKDGWALADLNLNLETQAGRDWHATLKFDLAKGRPVQEWSYGFSVLDAGYEQREGTRVRVLKRLDCDEISPVLRGAGVGTGTLSIKSAQLKDSAFAPLITQLSDLAASVGDDPAFLSATGRKQLSDIRVAIGQVLDRGTVDADQLAIAEAAFGTFMKHQSRAHLKA